MFTFTVHAYYKLSFIVLFPFSKNFLTLLLIQSPLLQKKIFLIKKRGNTLGTYMYYGICRFFKPYRSYNSCIHPDVILLLNVFLNAEISLEVKLKNAVVMKLVVKNTSSSYFVKVKIFCHFYFRYILITFKKFLSDKNIIVLHSVIKPRKDELFLY